MRELSLATNSAAVAASKSKHGQQQFLYSRKIHFDPFWHSQKSCSQIKASITQTLTHTHAHWRDKQSSKDYVPLPGWVPKSRSF